jgi:hypothetical protein
LRIGWILFFGKDLMFRGIVDIKYNLMGVLNEKGEWIHSVIKKNNNRDIYMIEYIVIYRKLWIKIE